MEREILQRDFLTESKIGHSVHYATAAALMFRYYGIPSRYVEGYLVTPEDVKDKKDGDKIHIPGKNGHAWNGDLYRWHGLGAGRDDTGILRSYGRT